MQFEDLKVFNPDILSNLTKVDLHLHTNLSDGTISPYKLISQIPKTGYHLVSITDHNSIDAYSNVSMNQCTGLGINILPGVEMDCGRGLDILVYDTEQNSISAKFQKEISLITKKEDSARLTTAMDFFKELIEWLESSDEKPKWINWQNWNDLKKGEFISFCNEQNLLKVNIMSGELDQTGRTYASKPHIAKLIERTELVNPRLIMKDININGDTSYNRIYQYLFKKKFSWKYDHVDVDTRLVQKIRDLGFIMILAHPGKTIEDIIGNDFNKGDFELFVENTILKYKLDGVECLYRSYKKDPFDYNKTAFEVLKKMQMKNKLKFFATAGSDRHDGF